jgi:hypothetical protein
MNDFIKIILGDEASNVLDRVVDRVPEFASVIVPRALIGWLNIMGKYGYEGEIPGQPNSYFSLVKNEDNLFTGAITIDNELYNFENAELLHVAASFGVALGIESASVSDQLKKRDLSDLGKNLDLLIKSNIVNNFKNSRVKISKYGDFTVEPQEDKFTVKHTPTNKVIFDGVEDLEKAEQIADWCYQKDELVKPTNSVKIKISKAESLRSCEICGESQIYNDKFVGCVCYKSLSKSIKLKKNQGSYLVSFSKDLDAEAISALISFFKD